MNTTHLKRLFLFFLYCFHIPFLKASPAAESLWRDGPQITLCTDIYDLRTFTCQSHCGRGAHLASKEEIVEAIKELNDELALGHITPEQHKEVYGNIRSAKSICLPGSGILRPSGAVFINSDYCACKGGTPDIVNRCAAFCSTTNDKTSTLYGSVTLGREVRRHKDLGSLDNWCNNPIEGSDYNNPACFLEVFDGHSTRQLSINIPRGSNRFSTNIEGLEYERSYVATIVESQSGSNARSSSFHIYRKKPQTIPRGYSYFHPSK